MLHWSKKKWELTNIKGFTLLEMLVVMIVIGVILSITTLTVGDGGLTKQVEHEAQRLAAVLKLASEQAIIQAEEIGISFDATGYRFYQLQGQTWQLLQEEVFRPYTFHINISVKLLIDGITPPTSACTEITCAPIPPLLFFSSGEITPYELTIFSVTNNISNKTLTYRVIGEATGKITVKSE